MNRLFCDICNKEVQGKFVHVPEMDTAIGKQRNIDICEGCWNGIKQIITGPKKFKKAKDGSWTPLI